MTPVEYITVPATVLRRSDLCDKAKLLLGLISGFNGSGLCMGDKEIADTFGISLDRAGRLVAELRSKGLIKIVNPQSRYRKIYSVKNNEVEQHKSGENNEVKPSTPLFLPPYSVVSTGIEYKRSKYIYVLRDNSKWELPPEKVSEYQTSFPGIDVHREMLKAGQWLIDNPAKRKTAKGMPRFLSGWLGRCKPDVQDVPPPPPAGTVDPEDTPAAQKIRQQARQKFMGVA